MLISNNSGEHLNDLGGGGYRVVSQARVFRRRVWRARLGTEGESGYNKASTFHESYIQILYNTVDRDIFATKYFGLHGV